MTNRSAFLISSILILIVVSGYAAFWSAPVRAAAVPDKTKKPQPTREEKTPKPKHTPKPKETEKPPPTDQPTPLPTNPRPTEPPLPTDLPPTATPGSTNIPPTITPAPTSVPPTATVVPTSIPTGIPTATSTPIPRTETPATAEKPPAIPPAPTDSPSPTVAAVSTETVEPTETAIPQAPTGTSTLSMTPVPIGTPTATPTRTSTPVAGVAPTPFASTIAANELLARPESIDWNGDGSIDADDEWIEIYNSSQSRVDLSGWHLSATDGRSTTTYTFPAGTTIAGRSYRVFYGNQTKVRLGASGEVRLLYPDRRVADIVRYPELGPDQSFVKSSDRGRTWTRDCIPSPHAPNCSAGATLTTTFNLSFFEKHIADASLITAIDQAVLATNALFAIILALIAGFFGNLLNAAIASPGAHVRQILGSLGALAERFRQVRLGLHARAPSRLLFWVGTPIKLSALFLGYGFIFAFLDPALDLREVDSWLLIFALAISVGILSVSVFAAQQLVLRQYGRHAHWRVRTGAIFLVLVTTVFSRLAGFVPGVLIAGPTGFEARQNPDLKIKLNLMAIGALVFVGLAMWVLAPLVDADAWFKTVVLLTFAAAVQTLFLELLPFENLHGRALFDSNRLAWFILFALTTLVLMQTMLNPDGSSLAAFQSPTMSVFSLVVALFALTSVIVSLYVHTPGNSRTDAIEREEGPKPL